MAMQGEDIKAVRGALRLNQRQFGVLLGLSDKYVGMMERGVPGAPVERRTELAIRYLAFHTSEATTGLTENLAAPMLLPIPLGDAHAELLATVSLLDSK